MNVSEAILRIAKCWEMSTGEKFDVHRLVCVRVTFMNTIQFELIDGNRYCIHGNSLFIETYQEWKGYKGV